MSFIVTATGAVGQINLSWTAQAGATQYQLGRATEAGYAGDVLYEGLNLSTVDSVPLPGLNFYYVKALINGAYVNSDNNPSAQSGSPAPTNIIVFDTATNVVRQVALESGLVLAPGVDPSTSSDANIQRLWTILRSAGNELLRMHKWQDKMLIYAFTTGVGDVGRYDLPADYDSFVDQTGWQQSYFWPLRGPYSAQMWQRVVNYPTTGIYVAFRIQNNALWLWPQPPPANIGITFMYRTRGWVTDGTSGVLKDHCDTGADIVNFDWLLITRYLKLKFLEAIGHDTVAADANFKMVFDVLSDSNDGAAPELELARDARFPFITGFNSPDTGFGGQPPAGGSYQ
jgi:hypothetical protein